MDEDAVLTQASANSVSCVMIHDFVLVLCPMKQQNNVHLLSAALRDRCRIPVLVRSSVIRNQGE